MSQLPPFLSVLCFGGIAAILASTCAVLGSAPVQAEIGRRRAATAAAVAALLMGAWFLAGTLIAEAGGYAGQPGRQIPWMPIAVTAWFGLLLALSRMPVVSRAVRSPGMRSRLLVPHMFRAVEGVVFLAAMALGLLPAIFAIPAGAGDIAVGVAAAVIVWRRGRDVAAGTLVRFTLLGILDLVVALTLGAVVGFGLLPGTSPAPAITGLPMVLIPTVAVPVLLVLHITSLIAMRVPAGQPATVA